MSVFLAALAALLISTTGAEAGPIAAAVTAVGTWLGTLGPVGAFLVRTVVGVALSSLSRLLQKKPERPDRASGIKTSITLTGGDNPDGMIAGWYATEGAWAGPWVQHGSNNRYMSQVIDLAGVPTTALSRVFVNGSPITLGSSPDPDFGLPAEGDYAGFLWIKFYDGTQTVADPMLMARGASDPDFPWQSDMIGLGRSYAIATALYDRELWQGTPSFRFELRGAAFYDMRKDSSIGGAGTHRLSDASTWEYTDNPTVMISHILLGYALADGSIYGGGADQADLPLADWAAAMNKCDALQDTTEGQEPAFRAGLEILFDEEPIENINALLQACDGDLVDDAGTFYPHVGGAGLPVFFFTDDDVIVSAPETHDAFPGLNQTFNGVTISYPEPDSSWEVKEAPPRLRPDLEALDQGRRLLTDVQLLACPYGLQAQRIGQAVVNDARRFRRHVVHLPPDAAFVRPLQTVSWTSTRYGYDGKLFEVAEAAKHLLSYQAQFTLREVDASDADFVPADELSTEIVSSDVTPPAAPAITGFVVEAIAIEDMASNGRRPAIKMSWDELRSVPVDFEVRVKSTAFLVAQGRMPSESFVGAIISQGILPEVEYRVRARFAGVNRPTDWTDWEDVTTLDIKFSSFDLGDGIIGSAQIADTLQSTNFVSGSTGWRIQKTGDMELNNLVARGWIQEGAISDQTQFFQFPETLLTALNLITNFGPIEPGQIWHRALFVEARGFGSQFRFESRVILASNPGVWLPWEQLASWNTGSTYTAFGSDKSAFGALDDVEYRLVAVGGVWVRNVLFTLTAVKK